MGIVRIFNLLTVCMFYTKLDPGELLSDKMCFFIFDCTMHLQGWLHSVSGHCFNLVFVTLPEPPPPLHTSGSDFVS